LGRTNYKSIKARMVALRITHEELAKRTGYSKSSMQNAVSPAYFRAGKGLRPVVLNAIEQVLKMAPGEAYHSSHLPGRLRRRLKLWHGLRTKIEGLDTSSEIKETIYDVLTDQEYPKRMSLCRTLVNNPIWNPILPERRKRLVSRHPLGSPAAPRIMHLDVFLIHATDIKQHGVLYTYHSRDWGTYLVPFRLRKSVDDPSARQHLNAAHLAMFLKNILSDQIEVTPLPSTYTVSVKPHAHTQDLIIYLFEYCSVKLSIPPKSASRVFVGRSHPNDDHPPRWFRVAELRRSKKAMEVNADVISSINDLFSVTLDGLPLSIRSRIRRR
jgi:hypothetical protein